MKLIAITNDQHTISDLASIIIKIIDFVDYVHIREKTKTCNELFLLISLLKEANIPFDKIVINDRLDVALLLSISNVHLPSHGLPIQVVKEQYPSMRIGKSIHTLKEAMLDESNGADYLLYGHCFETNCKKGITPNGISSLIHIKNEIKIPIYAVGGITVDNLFKLKKLKIDGIAVMSGIFSTQNPVESALQYYERCKC